MTKLEMLEMIFDKQVMENSPTYKAMLRNKKEVIKEVYNKMMNGIINADKAFEILFIWWSFNSINKPQKKILQIIFQICIPIIIYEVQKNDFWKIY